MANKITESIIVKGGPAALYNVWADFENLPDFMENIKSVEKVDDKTTHWVMEGPLDTTLEWVAETTAKEGNKRIAWSSKDREENDLKTSGQVTFSELPNNETEVTVMLQYVPPAGLAGEVVAALFVNPADQLKQDLRNFKRYVEAITTKA